jgi:coenzyme F420 hydrogenase subunit beta
VRLKNLQEVPAYQLCCGCGLCAYLHPKTINMVDSASFGRRPKFSDSASNSEEYRLAFELCPGVNISQNESSFRDKELIRPVPGKWGPIYEIYEGYAADPYIRYKGSSGGVMSAISLYCLEQEGMYGVLHTSADDKNPYLNKTILSRNLYSLLKGAGSRYSPASPCENLQMIEFATSPCVFVGKPCDVSAVNNARRHKPSLNEKVGLTMACFCAGTPSTNGTYEMLKRMQITSPADLTGLRYRGHGWPGKAVAEVFGNDNQMAHKELTYEQTWGEILEKYRQWRCYICPDHTGELADISVGDPWYRKETDGNNGYSMILIRSRLGQVIIEKAISAGYLILEKADPKILPASQPGFPFARSALWGRLFALRLSGAPIPSYKGFSLLDSWIKDLNLKNKAKSIIGTFKRVKKKHLRKTQIYL